MAFTKTFTNTCKRCNKIFLAKDRGVKFCSSECRYPPSLFVVKCKGCGQEFQQGYKTQRYCNKKCANKNKADPTKKTIYECKWCHMKFDGWICQPRQFCSASCHGKFYSTNPPEWHKQRKRDPKNYFIRNCEQCGKQFERHNCFIKVARFCSDDCRSIWISINRRGSNHFSWQGKYTPNHGPNWNRQRQKARERDNNTCQICNYKSNTRKLDVHHIIPFHNFNGDYEKANNLENLITLCRPCHRKEDAKLQRQSTI